MRAQLKLIRTNLAACNSLLIARFRPPVFVADCHCTIRKPRPAAIRGQAKAESQGPRRSKGDLAMRFAAAVPEGQRACAYLDAMHTETGRRLITAVAMAMEDTAITTKKTRTLKEYRQSGTALPVRFRMGLLAKFSRR